LEQYAPRRRTRRGLTASAVTALAGFVLLPAATARAAAVPDTDMFTSNGVFTVPAGVTEVTVTVDDNLKGTLPTNLKIPTGIGARCVRLRHRSPRVTGAGRIG